MTKHLYPPGIPGAQASACCLTACGGLLQVGPGEVDPTLEDEVGTECTKYGAVAGVVIFEACPRPAPPIPRGAVTTQSTWRPTAATASALPCSTITTMRPCHGPAAHCTS